MTTLYTYSPAGRGTYLVHDALAGLYSIGRVHKLGRAWVATPHGVGVEETGKRFATRREAAHALARYLDTGDAAWITRELIGGRPVLTDARGVRYLMPGAPLDALPHGWAQCGTCGRSWDDETSTACTPAPAARCPFEYEHRH